MGRIRSIKPEFWSDAKIKKLSHGCMAFFIGLWNFCDDEGKFKIDPLELSLRMPTFRSQDILKWVWILAEHELVLISTRAEWGLVKNWRHQKIDRPRAALVKNDEIQWITHFDSTSIRRAFDERSTIIRRKDRIGKDRKDRIVYLPNSLQDVSNSKDVLVTSQDIRSEQVLADNHKTLFITPDPAPPVVTEPSQVAPKKKRKNIYNEGGVGDFEEIYSSYPRKLGKTKGHATFLKTVKTVEDFENLKKAIKNYIAQIQEEETKEIYIKHFSTFMNCWRDYVDYKSKRRAAFDYLYELQPQEKIEND